MKSVVIVHGTGGSPEGNWFPWMKAELSKLGLNVSIPKFPTPDGQSFSAWADILKTEVISNPSETILVGHSIGAPFVLRILEEAQNPYMAAFMICPFTKELGFPDYDVLNSTFVNHVFDWEKIRRGSKKIFCYAGDNDPYVPQDFSLDVAKNLNVNLNVIPNGGHLNAEFGYLKFPDLLKAILDI